MDFIGKERNELMRLLERQDNVGDELIESLLKAVEITPSVLLGYGYDEALRRMAVEIKVNRLSMKIAREGL